MTVPADPTGGGAALLETTIINWMETYGIPALIGIFAVGLIVAVLIRFGKKSVSSI